MKQVKNEEVNQMLVEAEVELFEIDRKEIKIENKEIEVLKISNCKLENIELIHCNIHKVWIKNSNFEHCKFMDIELQGEDAQIHMEESSFQDCVIENIDMNALQESSEWIAIKFRNTKFRNIHLYTNIEINESRFEFCEGNKIEFQGNRIKSCVFYEIKGESCNFQAKLIENKLKAINIRDYYIKVDMLEVEEENL